MGNSLERSVGDFVNSESTGGWLQDVDSFDALATRGGMSVVTPAWYAGSGSAASGLLDAIGELGHLIEEVAVDAHLLVDLSHRVQHRRVVTAPKLGADLRE